MINSHQFQQAAKQFRAGRISLKEFTDLVIGGVATRKPNEEAKQANPVKSEPMAENLSLSSNAGSNAARTESRSAAKATKEASSPIGNPGLAQLPVRPAESHKGDFGRVVAIGGSLGMAGAISLSGMAALRSGSGLVKVLVPDSIQSTVATFSPCLMTVGCQSEGGCFADKALDQWMQHGGWADVIALGPGMGRAKSVRMLAGELYAKISKPMVVDADGLNVLAEGKSDLSEHAGDRILTPHPGEFQRLIGSEMPGRDEMELAAKKLAGDCGVVVVLKGHRTYVTDGEREYRNDTGNPGMATAGSGDVLTGVVASLLGRGLSAFDAAALAVCVHGIAGDFAAEEVGETSLIATDITDHLSAAFKKHAHSSGTPIGFGAG